MARGSQNAAWQHALIALSGTVIATVMETSRPLLDAARHTLTVTLPPEQTVLEADPIRLAQVLVNLLNNAAKYTHAGGRIELTVQRRDGHLVLRVQDNGIGIAPDMLPHLFEIFSQEARTEDRAQGGLGIGLSLVRGLVELHGGTVEAHSDGPGRGSEFVVIIPL